jgi:hypothetical protein
MAHMDSSANISANKPSAQAVASGRRGRPKGLPKPEGSGRRAGVPNRITRDIRATAAKHSTKAIATLVKLLGDNDPKIRAIAARELLDRAHGKPLSPQEITGKDGAPLNPAPDLTAMQRAQKLAFIFARQLHNQGYRIDGKGKISPKTPASPEPASDRTAEIEAAQAALQPQAAAPGPAPEEIEAARREREEQRYLLSRSAEQGFGEVNRPNVIRMRPHGK